MSETTDQTENQDLVIEEDDKVAKEKYLANSGICPYCGSGNVFTEESDENMNEDHEQWISCGNCDEQWTDIYEMKLVDVDFETRDWYWTKEVMQNRKKKRTPKKL